MPNMIDIIKKKFYINEGKPIVPIYLFIGECQCHLIYYFLKDKVYKRKDTFLDALEIKDDELANFLDEYFVELSKDKKTYLFKDLSELANSGLVGLKFLDEDDTLMSLLLKETKSVELLLNNEIYFIVSLEELKKLKLNKEIDLLIELNS